MFGFGVQYGVGGMIGKGQTNTAALRGQGSVLLYGSQPNCNGSPASSSGAAKVFWEVEHASGSQSHPI